MSKEDSKLSIQGFYDTLTNNDLDGLLSFCTEDAILTWAFFRFIGREEIKQWALEFGEHFTELSIENISIAQKNNYTVHRFIIRITLQDGRRGWLPSVGKYEFKNGKLYRIWITPLPRQGCILIKPKDIV